jgi:hypothetical protein
MQIHYPFTKGFLIRLLGLVLADHAFGVRVLQVVDPSLFSTDVAKTIFAASCAYSRVTNSVPSVPILHQLITQRHASGAIDSATQDESVAMVVAASKVDALTRSEAHAVLREAVLHAGLGQALDESWVAYKNHDYDHIKNTITSAYDRVRMLDLGGMGRSMARNRTEYVREVAAGIARVDRLPLGIAPFDDRLLGGLGRGELGCVMANRKAGKSMALCHIAQTTVLAGLTVVYITLELAERVVENRITAGLVDLPTNEITYGGEEIAGLVDERLAHVLRSTGGDYVVKQFPPKTAQVSDVESYLRDINALWDVSPDVLIVDYADELYSKADDMYHRADDIYAQLKALGSPPNSAYSVSGGFDCAVHTASQVQRSAMENSIIKMNHADKSIEKASKVDLMWSVSSDCDEAEVGLLHIYIAGCRYAPGSKNDSDIIGPFSTDFSRGRLFNPLSVKRFGETWEHRIHRNATKHEVSAVYPTGLSHFILGESRS